MLPVSVEPADCAICDSIYVNPQKTPCNHTFCKDCITSWIENTVRKKLETTCPTCRQAISVETLSDDNDAQGAVGAMAQKAQEAAKAVIIEEKKEAELTEFSSIEGAVSSMKAFYLTQCAEQKRHWQFEAVVKGRRFMFINHYDPNIHKYDPKEIEELTNKFAHLGGFVYGSASIAKTKVILYAQKGDQDAAMFNLTLITALNKVGISAVGSIVRH